AHAAGDTGVNDYGLPNPVGRISDAIVAVARLIASGHVTRYGNAKIFVPMGAAGLPFLLGRLKRNHKITPGIADPAEGLALLYTDSILHDPRVLRFVVDMLGADRVMMGSDMPFPIGDEEPAKIVTAAGLKADQVASITGGRGQKMFPVGVVPPQGRSRPPPPKSPPTDAPTLRRGAARPTRRLATPPSRSRRIPAPAPRWPRSPASVARAKRSRPLAGAHASARGPCRARPSPGCGRNL